MVSPGFVFMLERSASSQGPRLGITASRRVGNAPQRNRAKRIVREAFRAVRSTWPPVDVVVIVRQALGNRTLDDVLGEWQAARGRILRRCAELTETPDAADNGAADTRSVNGRSVKGRSVNERSVNERSAGTGSSEPGAPGAAAGVHQPHNSRGPLQGG